MNWESMSEYFLAYTDDKGDFHFRFCCDDRDVNYWITKFSNRGYKTFSVFKELGKEEFQSAVTETHA